MAVLRSKCRQHQRLRHFSRVAVVPSQLLNGVLKGLEVCVRFVRPYRRCRGPGLWRDLIGHFVNDSLDDLEPFSGRECPNLLGCACHGYKPNIA